ncbi:unnamed protein product [Phytophthora fragariaefolia]|uniref:Unnamed protein product n=1 Tax=Phytophthora fragariaefolia TaxID=1490495 RepID=A0A9W7CNG8_9STRA|nr:unnamed protein product [Phytophthora fragariaefolia]
MTAILGSGAVNEDKFTEWNTSQKFLGLQFDTIAETISIPAAKIAKVRNFVASALPEPAVVVEMDACDYGLCALDTKANIALTYRFSPHELQLIARFKTGEANGFNINFRELLSCAFATHEWGPWWPQSAPEGRRPLHVHFHIDNTSAVAWQNRLASRNTRAQDIIRLLGYWESSLNLRFSASHIAGVDNTRADAGSRIAAHPAYATKFKELTRGWTQVSPTIDVRGLSSLWRNISATIRSSAIKKAAAQNGEDPKNFRPHSFRAGAATHMYRAVVDAMTIQFYGRWVSDTFKTYTNLCAESVTSPAANMVTGSKEHAA